MEMKHRRRNSLSSSLPEIPVSRRMHNRVKSITTSLILLVILGALVYPRPRDHRAKLQPIEVLPRGEDACVEAMGGAKVAFLFLTAGDLYHTSAWTHWFRSAAGVVPAETAVETACKLRGVALEAAGVACMAPGVDVIGDQHLFNVYVHLTKDVHESVLNKLWRPYLIPNRIKTEWGTHLLIEATRNLLWQAYRDPANERFVLLSESNLPIWDPLTTYRELIAEKRSRVDAWWHPELKKGRWTTSMNLTAGINLSDWRKSAQWFSLTRSHVKVVLEDIEVFSAFEDSCKSGWDPDMKRWRMCYSDEHYIPTLLYKQGLEEETVPSPLGITSADWSAGGSHPREYQPSEINADLFFDKLRKNEDCPLSREDHGFIQESARLTFAPIMKLFGPNPQAWCVERSRNRPDALDVPLRVSITDAKDRAREQDSSLHASEESERKLPAMCYLFARKFGASTVKTVEKLFLNCSSGLDLVGDTLCDLETTKLP